jgi:hypothetical protein
LITKRKSALAKKMFAVIVAIALLPANAAVKIKVKL